MANPEQKIDKKVLDTAENMKSKEQIQAKSDILQSINQFLDKNAPNKDDANQIKEVAVKVLNAMQIENVDMKDIRDSKYQ